MLEYQVEQLYSVLYDCCVHNCFLSVIVALAGKFNLEKYVALCANERRHFGYQAGKCFLLFNLRIFFINLSLLLYKRDINILNQVIPCIKSVK